MLQPRLFGCAFKMFPSFGSFVCVAVILSSAVVSCQETNNESIEATRIKREGVSENKDLTVLLVNDQQRSDNSRIGRYHSVKPLIGLLTSTARTFIQDGVTTEFATQILGTTLNNGRIYAQLLTKSSLVLYNKPNEDVVVKPTRVHSAFDGQWSVKQDLGFIDPDKFALKNTDYLAPSSKMDIVYASKPAQEVKFWTPTPEQEYQVLEELTARRVQPNNEVPRYQQNEAYNFLDGPSVETDKKYEFIVKPAILENINALHRQSKAYEPVTEPIKVDSRIKEELNESNIVKVKPNYDLPTFTIKNEFSPIFYYIDNVESRNTPQPSGQQTKLPKKLFGQKSEARPKKTFTYAGFADFTTVVGDTVIVFTPNTDVTRPQSPDEVNVFPSAKHVDKLNTKVTFLAADIPVATATYKPYEEKASTKITTSSSNNKSGAVYFNDEESLKKVRYDIDGKMPDGVSVQNNGFDFNLDVIQPSEAAVTTTESTRLTDDLEVIPIQEYNSQATDPLGTLKPSATIIEESKESAVTENNLSQDFVTSEEESENTASEVTEKTEEEEEEEENEEVEGNLAEEHTDIVTTTESGHSEESYEDIETTTETKHDIEERPICANGLETELTMTTAYKTLTYLTTYFIPLESLTTTSVKSDVVVESNVGYLTNVQCKSDVIEPTSVYKVNVQSSVHSSLESTEVDTEESIVSPPSQPADVVTESAPKTTLKENEATTTTQEQEEETGTTVKDRSVEDVKSIKDNDNISADTETTTTERVSTSHSHVEVSVSTEHVTTPTEKPGSEADEEDDSKENEIDLIYKTLYTTYTYFTTFFGDQTSSVASHKSVVTNVITSTINLAKLDPSLLGAFDEDEIAPTSVGIGRPTESYAINSIIDLVKNKDVLESVQIGEAYSSQTPTPSLGDDVASIKPDAVKTYFTTYTFFTTIYVGTDANVCSRSEVYTNYVGPDELIPTKSNPLGTDKTKAQFDFRNCKQKKREPAANPDETSSMETSVSMEENDESKEDSEEIVLQPNPVENRDAVQPSPVEVDMLFSVESNPLDTESVVTDVKSSSSRGERQYIENNNILDDQISSESNIDEIMPSPTLLLQTSYTTFTYFTTMYLGKDSSKIKSRLETITNVVTETIVPKREPEEESNLPITYYTTFTYWTTLVKDKITTITSREEIVSNIVTPVVQVAPTISPIDTTPIDIESVLPQKELEVELKPSLINDSPEQDDGKATFYTTYTYFTTFYAGNSSQIRSSLETVTNIVENTKVIEDNQLGRKVPTGPVDKNIIQDNGEKPRISPTVVKEEIKPTQLPDISAASPTVLAGTYIDNLFEIKPADNNTPTPDTDKKIIFSQVAIIAGDSVIVTNDNKTLNTESTTTNPVTNGSTTPKNTIISPTPEVIESSVAEPETASDYAHDSEEEEEDDTSNTRKKSRLTFTTKKPSFTPVIIPFASRNRPTFSPKRVPLLSSATIITRADATPTITATPTLKSVRPSGFGGNRKASSLGGLSSSSKRFSGRSSISNPSANVPSASRSGGFGNRPSIQPTSRRTGFRSSSIRNNDFASRSAVPRIRPTASSRIRGNRQSASISLPPIDQNESETSGTQQEENVTEPLNEVTEAPVRTTNNPLLRFRRPPVARQPGTAVTPRSTTPSTRRTTSRGRLTTTTRRPTTRSTTNPLLSLRRQRPGNSLFPRRNLFKQPEPEPEEEIKENEQEVEESEEILEGEEFEEDNDYESSDRKEQQVATPSTPAPKKNVVQIRPFAFRRRTKRQVDYGSRKLSNFRRPGLKSATTKAAEPEPETEPPVTQKARPGSRFNSRLSSQTRTTTSTPQKVSQRQPFIVRGESRTTASHRQTTTTSPAYRRNKSKATSRTTTIASRPKAPKLLNRNSQSERSRSPLRSSTSRSRTRTTTSRGSSRQRNSFENYSGERQNYKNVVDNGKLTVTHHIPTEVTIPVVNGKITEYKNVLTAKPSIEVLLRNQVATTLGPLGNQQLVIASESTKLAENGATEVIKFYLHETPTTTVIFTPTTIRGRKTSYSHVLPSTVYNVEPVTQTIAPEINANVPLANLLLSQLLLGNQQPAINPLLALQGQGLLPQQPVAQTPVTEFKTRTTTYVTTVTDARETVLSITFKGKAILTTIVDPTTNVITATEFVTDTIVSTPTALAPPPQFNSLLLPLLLQQQQQQQQALQTPNPLLGLGQTDFNLLQNNNLNNDIYSNSPKPNILPDLNGNEDFSEESDDVEEDVPPPPPPRSRNKPRAPKPAPPKLTSVVTMYVSGRYPAFNTNGIVYDNSPWRPGRDIDLVDRGNSEDERRFKNLATKVLSNGVEVLVKDKNDGKQEQTKYMEVKTIKPSSPSKIYQSNFVKIDKRIDNDNGNSFDLIQPSEAGHTSCTGSCSCSHTKTESLKTKHSNVNDASAPAKYAVKTSKYDTTKLELRPTPTPPDTKSKYNPYEYENSSQMAPTDKVVEKYTEVMNDYSDEKDSNSVEESELLTNEQAPGSPKPSKAPVTKSPEKQKPEKAQKPNKNKNVVADLLKLGSLGIKGLSQLAPVLEKMTGGFIKRQEDRSTTTTIKPISKLTAYSVDKRIDTDMETKSNFPIYIPVDELETAESQIAFTNATLHQNLAWAAEHKQPKRIVPPKMIHESPLVNGGIPISPGEIITANSDVIVGRPAVGRPLTLAASGIKLQNPVNPPALDSLVAANEQYYAEEKPPVNEVSGVTTKVDDSFDLRPPELPRPKIKPTRNVPRPTSPTFNYYNSPPTKNSPRPPISHVNDHVTKTEKVKPSSTILGNHGRPVFLDYIPSLDSNRPEKIPQDSDEIPDNSPSSSEVISTRVRVEDSFPLPDHNVLMNKPFLVDIQPSRVANVLIPHGSSTALVFAGSSEPHKTGDYVDDPLPYPEPGYFGSFSIDAPQMTNVHNASPNKQFIAKPTHRPLEPYKPNAPIYKNHTFKNDQKIKWKDSKSSYDYNKIPPPSSNQETFLQVGPHITAYNPNIYHHNNGDFEKYNHVRGKEKQKEVIDNEYENYLAVPPPPPKMQFNRDTNNDNNKPYSQKPIVHIKPVQDMKVFLNIQHPVPKPQKDQLPPKITSEIYFAAQMPSSKPTPVYTVHIPPPGSSYGNSFNHVQSQQSESDTKGNSGPIYGSVSGISPPTYANKSIANNGHEKDGTYTVTLNTATNVANNVGDAGQVIGSSVPVSVGNAPKYGEIPISTNFAIRVEDDATHSETYNLHNNKKPATSYDVVPVGNHDRSPIKVSMGDNRWNTSSIIKNESQITNEDKDYYNGHNEHGNVPNPSIAPSLNSHANFPMMKDSTTQSNDYSNVKPVTEYIDDIKLNDQKRPAKLIPNIPTNSHGWYSSVPINENTFNSITNIKVESTTRKVIPLLHDYNKESVPHFGQKVTSAGKPPSEFWGSDQSPTLTHHGKPFTKPQEPKIVYSSQSPIINRPFSSNYIPSNLGVVKQPAYDIPIRDNSDETTTVKYRPTSAKTKPVFENAEEVYDGEEELDNSSELDGEVSQESIKVPVVSTSSEMENASKSTTQIVLLQDEVIPNAVQNQKDKNVNLVDFDPGTQTEKPFRSSNKTVFSSNTIKPIYDQNPYMNPRPFTVDTGSTLDHQLHQPHWQINEMLENSTNISYEDNLELNTGEEMSTVSTSKPATTRKSPYYRPEPGNKYKRPPRPVFSARPNSTLQAHDPNIITSTVHIQDKKPLVVEKANEKTTLPTFTITTHLDVNRTSSEIIDLSPPPPTMDYNFKPSTNDEMIMGMSPPPPRTPPAIRQPVRTTPRPIRTPHPYRTSPPRTLSPRLTTQRPTRKPITRDEVSTYRPAYEMLNNIKRPAFNRGQPSSQLLPPPKEPSRVVPINDSPTERPTPSNVIFPTPVSSGWLTSSGVEFASGFEFEPTSIQFPESVEPSRIPQLDKVSTESTSTEAESSGDRIELASSEKPVSEENISDSSKESTDQKTSFTFKEPISTESVSKESQEDVSTERIKYPTGGYRNRTRRPYPSRDSTNKYKVTTKPTSTSKPIKTRPEILYPTRPTPTKKIPQIRPILSHRPNLVTPSSIIESSESPVEENFIKPTEVLKTTSLPSVPQLDASTVIEKVSHSMLGAGTESSIVIKPTHHAGNEVKVFDEIIPTKTEFKTTVITFTKTLSEPPKIVSSFVNLTHTLTVTHTETSLVSKSEGAVTETLVLTNTHTSTIVDVVTEVYTHVLPTTIIETVTEHIPIIVEPTSVVESTTTKTKLPLDDVTMSSEESDNFIIKDSETTENIQKIQTESDGENDTFFVVMNKSQNGGNSPSVQTEIETGDYDGVTRNEQVNSNGVSQVLFGEILLAGTPYLETTNVGQPAGPGYGKECQPDCKASRNERCQRIDGLMKCVCRPGFARMFPDRPCKPTYTYSVKLALGTQGNERLHFHESLADNSSKEYQALAFATHEGINRMVMQSDLRDVFHGVHITGFHPIEMRSNGELFQGVMNDFYVQLSDNAHESRLKEVLEKYLRHNNYSLGGTDVHAAGEMVDRLEVNDFDECVSGQFHDCSEHSQCFNLRGTYTCSCLEGYADLSVNPLYPGRICSAEPVGCERCNYHGACYSRDDRRVLCECFQWYAGSACHINLKVVLISLVVVGALLTAVLAACAVVACSRRPRPPPRSIVACIQGMPGLPQGAIPSKQRADRRALINERADSGDASSVQNASLPYMPAKRPPGKKCVMSPPPAHEAPPPPAPAVMIPRARLHPHHSDSRENISRKKSFELSSEAKLISYLESGAVNPCSNDEMRRKHSMESSYSAMKERHNKQGNMKIERALVSAGFKVSTTVRADEPHDRDDASSVHKDVDDLRFDSLRKSYSQEDLSEWTDAERRLGELTLSEARSVGGTLPASTGRAASSTRLTHQEANTMAERDLGSTFLLPHVHLYKPDLTSDISEFDSL